MYTIIEVFPFVVSIIMDIILEVGFRSCLQPLSDVSLLFDTANNAVPVCKLSRQIKIRTSDVQEFTGSQQGDVSKRYLQKLN